MKLIERETVFYNYNTGKTDAVTTVVFESKGSRHETRDAVRWFISSDLQRVKVELPEDMEDAYTFYRKIYSVIKRNRDCDRRVFLTIEHGIITMAKYQGG